MSKKKKVLVLILICFILFLILRYAYSKYINQIDISKDVNVAKWNIKINDQDITEDVHDFIISDFTWDEEAHVKKPKVAPGMKGYFTLKLDPTGTDVSVKYTIKIDETKLREISNIDLKITGIEENGVKQELNFDEEGNIIIEKIKKLEQIKSETDAIDTIRIEVSWENLDTDEGNKNDSEVSKLSGTKIQMPINVNVIQYTSD